MCIGNKKSSHGTSLNLETETETKVEENSRLETETETLEMPETRPRRESRLVSVREMVETESLADPWSELQYYIAWEGTFLNKRHLNL